MAPGPVLKVLPDADRVEGEMVADAGERGFVDGANYLSFGQLLDGLGGAELLGRRRCSALTARVTLWSAAQGLGVSPFGAFVHEPAFARLALELIFDLKSGEMSPAEFGDAVQSIAESRRPRAQYLARLYGSYEARMKELGLADREDLARGALLRLSEKGLPERFRRYSELRLSGLYDFPPLRISLLLALAKAAEAAGVRLRLEVPGAGSAGVDAAVDGALAEIEKRGQALSAIEVVKGGAASGARLFMDAPEDRSLPKPELFAAATARAEVREMARRARAWVDAGVAPERIALCFRDLGEEAEWLEEELAHLDLPARIRRGAPLGSTSVGRLALGLPLLVDDGYPAADVAMILTSRYAPAAAPKPRAPVGRWLTRASVRDDRLGAQGEKGAYEIRLTALADRLAALGLERDATEVREVLRASRDLMKLCERIPEQARASELLERWWSAVGDLGVLKAVRVPEPRDEEGTPLGRAVLRALARDQAAADALMELTGELQAALGLSGAGKQRMHRRTFHRWLLDAAEDYSLAANGPRAGAVRVLDVRELPARRFAAVCTGGLTDGRFPGRESPHGLFGDEDRRAINQIARRGVFRTATGDAGAKLAWRLAEDRLLLYVALTCSERPPVLSHARLAPNGVEQVPSPFLDELRRLTGVAMTPRPLRPVPPLGEVESEIELRERLALEAFALANLRSSVPELSPGAVREQVGSEAWLEAARELSQIEQERLGFFSDLAKAPGPHSGAVADETLLPLVREAFKFGPERPVDATTLQRFGNCAFQGFLAYVMRLEDPDEPGEEIDPRPQGSFWHRVLELLFPKLKEQGLLGAAASEVPEALIDEALQTAAAEIEKTDHVGHPALWSLGREKARAMVRRILGSELRGLPFDGHVPTHTELKFGYPTSPEEWREVAIPGLDGEAPVHLKGKIDRIDTAARGLGVIDYKSGGSKSDQAKLRKELLATHFQLPIYLYAARESGHPGALSAALLSMRDGQPVRLEDVIGKQTVEELLAADEGLRKKMLSEGKHNLANAVHALVRGLREGKFPARPRDCKLCSFRAICRITERRIEENGG